VTDQSTDRCHILHQSQHRTLWVVTAADNVELGKSSVSELRFFLNRTTVIDNIIIKKGVNYLLNDGKSTAKSVYYLHSRSVNDR